MLSSFWVELGFILLYLVAERLGGDEGNLLDDPLVGVEVESELGVVLLDDDTCGLLDGFGSDATHGEQRGICKGGMMYIGTSGRSIALDFTYITINTLFS